MLNAFIKIIRRRWAEYILEIIVIIISIIAAFMLDAWKKGTEDRALERIYLEEILRDLKDDNKQLKEVIYHQSSNKLKVDWCIEELMSQDINMDSLAIEFQTAFTNNITFFPHDGSYLSLISEGGMRIITNKSVSSSITNLYEHWYQRLIYNGELLDKRVDETLFASQDYFIHEMGTFLIDDVNETYMLSQLNYLARARRISLKRANDTMNAIEQIEDLIEEAM